LRFPDQIGHLLRVKIFVVCKKEQLLLPEPEKNFPILNSTVSR